MTLTGPVRLYREPCEHTWPLDWYDNEESGGQCCGTCGFAIRDHRRPEPTDTLLKRILAWVKNFEDKNPSVVVRSHHPEYFLLKECADVIEAVEEYIQEYEVE